MAYTPLTWENDPDKTSGGLEASNEVNAERLQHMDDGIAAAHTALESVGGGGTGTAVSVDGVEAVEGDVPLSAVRTTGDQTVGGVKTFSVAPVVPDDSFTTAKVDGLADALAATVNTSGDQTIAGAKEFTDAPVFPVGSIPLDRIAGIVAELTNRAPSVYWDATANTWGARPDPGDYPMVTFWSTNDPDATAPDDVNRQVGDTWKRHPDAPDYP